MRYDTLKGTSLVVKPDVTGQRRLVMGQNDDTETRVLSAVAAKLATVVLEKVRNALARRRTRIALLQSSKPSSNMPAEENAPVRDVVLALLDSKGTAEIVPFTKGNEPKPTTASREPNKPSGLNILSAGQEGSKPSFNLEASAFSKNRLILCIQPRKVSGRRNLHIKMYRIKAKHHSIRAVKSDWRRNLRQKSFCSVIDYHLLISSSGRAISSKFECISFEYGASQTET